MIEPAADDSVRPTPTNIVADSIQRVAIALVLGNRIPIPVSNSRERPACRQGGTRAPLQSCNSFRGTYCPAKRPSFRHRLNP
jgi:hypothetical protein